MTKDEILSWSDSLSSATTTPTAPTPRPIASVEPQDAEDDSLNYALSKVRGTPYTPPAPQQPAQPSAQEQVEPETPYQIPGVPEHAREKAIWQRMPIAFRQRAEGLKLEQSLAVQGSIEEREKAYEQYKQYRAAYQDLGGNWFVGAAAMLPDMMQGIGGRAAGTLAGTAIGAGAAAVGGAFIPAPEEVATVPLLGGAGATLGGKIGGFLGGAAPMYLQGKGQLYADMRDQGIPDDIANKISAVGAGPYAALEFINIYLPGSKLLGKGGTELAKRELNEVIIQSVKKQLMKTGVKEFVAGTLTRTLTSGGFEASEEFWQAINNDIWGNIAAKIAKIPAAEKPLQMILKGAFDEFKAALGPSMVLGGPSSVVRQMKETANKVKSGEPFTKEELSQAFTPEQADQILAAETVEAKTTLINQFAGEQQAAEGEATDELEAQGIPGEQGKADLEAEGTPPSAETQGQVTPPPESQRLVDAMAERAKAKKGSITAVAVPETSETKATEAAAKALGYKNVIWVDNKSDKPFWATFDEDGNMYVSKDMPNPGPVAALHETLHRVARDKPQAFQALVEIVNDTADTTQVAELQSKLKKSMDALKENTPEEMTAQILQEFGTDKAFWQEIAEKSKANPKQAGLVREALQRIVEMLDDFMAKLGAGDNAASAQLNKMFGDSNLPMVRTSLVDAINSLTANAQQDTAPSQISENATIAKELGIRYDGELEKSPEPSQYTDTQKGPALGASFYVKEGATLEEVRVKMEEVRQKFAAAETKPTEPVETLPPRTADTMSDAIALSSPSGKMSKRQRALAEKRLSEKLFGPGGLKKQEPRQPTPIEKAANIREIAKLANRSQAKKLIAEAEALEQSAETPLRPPQPVTPEEQVRSLPAPEEAVVEGQPFEKKDWQSLYTEKQLRSPKMSAKKLREAAKTARLPNGMTVYETLGKKPLKATMVSALVDHRRRFLEATGGKERVETESGFVKIERMKQAEEAKQFIAQQEGELLEEVEAGTLTAEEAAKTKGVTKAFKTMMAEHGKSRETPRTVKGVSMWQEEETGKVIARMPTGEEVAIPKRLKLAKEFKKHQDGKVEPLPFMAAGGATPSLQVSDRTLLNQLESGKKIKVFRAMQLIDGKLYPPMSAKIGRTLRAPTQIGAWEQAEERPDLIDADGNFKLSKGDKKTIKARYNPYFHTSKSPLNDQFTSASTRANLVTVEAEIPASELTSGYKAEKAKDSVGEKPWRSGPVSSKLPSDRKRSVILSRYAKVVRIVPDSEVAQNVASQLEGTGLSVPAGVVTPSLNAELVKAGVPVESPSPRFMAAQDEIDDNTMADLLDAMRNPANIRSQPGQQPTTPMQVKDGMTVLKHLKTVTRSDLESSQPIRSRIMQALRSDPDARRAQVSMEDMANAGLDYVEKYGSVADAFNAIGDTDFQKMEGWQQVAAIQTVAKYLTTIGYETGNEEYLNKALEAHMKAAQAGRSAGLLSKALDMWRVVAPTTAAESLIFARMQLKSAVNTIFQKKGRDALVGITGETVDSVSQDALEKSLKALSETRESVAFLEKQRDMMVKGWERAVKRFDSVPKPSKELADEKRTKATEARKRLAELMGKPDGTFMAAKETGEQDYIVTLTFESPAWDERDGIPFEVSAKSKSEAIKIARATASDEGHAIGGRGRYSFRAELSETQSDTGEADAVQNQSQGEEANTYEAIEPFSGKPWVQNRLGKLVSEFDTYEEAQAHAKTLNDKPKFMAAKDDPSGMSEEVAELLTAIADEAFTTAKETGKDAATVQVELMKELAAIAPQYESEFGWIISKAGATAIGDIESAGKVNVGDKKGKAAKPAKDGDPEGVDPQLWIQSVLDSTSATLDEILNELQAAQTEAKVEEREKANKKALERLQKLADENDISLADAQAIFMQRAIENERESLVQWGANKIDPSEVQERIQQNSLLAWGRKNGIEEADLEKILASRNPLTGLIERFKSMDAARVSDSLLPQNQRTGPRAELSEAQRRENSIRTQGRIFYELQRLPQYKTDGEKAKSVRSILDNIISQPLQYGETIQEQLKERIIDAGWSESDAELMAKKIADGYAKVVDKEMRRRLYERFIKSDLRRGAEDKRAVENIIMAARTQMLSDTEMMEAFQDSYGIRTIGAEERAEIDRLGKLIEEASTRTQDPSSALVRDSQDALNKYLHSLMPRNWLNLLLTFRKASMLSGFSTTMVNTVSTAFQTAGNIETMIVKEIIRGNFKNVPILLRGAMEPLTGEAAKEFRRITKTKSQPWKYNTKFESGMDVNPMEHDPIFNKGGYKNPLKWLTHVFPFMQAQDWNFYLMNDGATAALVTAKELSKNPGITDLNLQREVARKMGWGEDFKPFVEQARKEGWTGEKMYQRAYELRRGSWSEEAQLAGSAAGNVGTFNVRSVSGMLGYISRAIQNLKRVDYLPVRVMTDIIFPFVGIPFQVGNAVIANSPLGFIRTMHSFPYLDPVTGKPINMDLKKTSTNEERAAIRELKLTWGVQATQASLLMLGGMFYFLSQWKKWKDDDEKEDLPSLRITAYGDPTSGRAKWYAAGNEPYSISVNGKTISYRAWTPLIPVLAPIGAMMDMLLYGGSEDPTKQKGFEYRVALASLMSMPRAVIDQTSLMQLSDLLSIFESSHGKTADQTVGKINTLMARTTTSFVPNLLKQIDNIFDPTLYDNKTIGAAFLDNMPFAASHTLNKRLNIFGEEITQSRLRQFYSLPVPHKEYDADPVAKWLIVNDIPFGFPSVKIMDKDPRTNQRMLRSMTDEERYQFTLIWGPMIRKSLETAINSGRYEHMSQDRIQKSVLRMKKTVRKRALYQFQYPANQ